MGPYAEGDLRIDVEAEAGALRLLWRGKSNARDPGATLSPFFETIAAEAARAGVMVEMRLHELEYFNSSTLAAIIRAIRRFRERAIRIRIAYPQSGWQRRSCEALRVLEGDGMLEVRGD